MRSSRECSVEEVQGFLAEITFAPFWWFRVVVGGGDTWRLNAKHATISSTKEFNVEGAIRVWEALSNGQAEIDLHASDGCIHLWEKRGPGDIAVLAQDVLEGWTVIDAWLDLPGSHRNRAGLLMAMQTLIKGVQGHETDEFLKVDGVHVKDPHPKGGNTFYYAPLKTST